MTVEEMRRIKQENGFSYAQISEASGIPLSTVQKVLMGETQSPRFQTMQALERVFSEWIANSISKENAYLKLKLLGEPYLVKEDPATDGANTLKDLGPEGDTLTISEEMMVWAKLPQELRVKKQGEYTYEDYLLLPEELHFELIDGIFYDLASPKFRHQVIIDRIGDVLKEYVKKQKGKCVVMPFSFDTVLQENNRTCVQPDLQIICDREKISDERVKGVPDLVMEVLSTSTRKKDMTIKLHKYMDCGVREYWIVDIKNKNVIVYIMEPELTLQVYTFEEQIPVNIWEGKCRVDMKEVMEEVFDILPDHKN